MGMFRPWRWWLVTSTDFIATGLSTLFTFIQFIQFIHIYHEQQRLSQLNSLVYVLQQQCSTEL
jgi:hypothetical protein